MNINEKNLDLANEIISKDGSLDENFFEGVSEGVSKLQQNYLAAGQDKTTASKEMANLNGVVAQTDSIKETNKMLAQAIADGDMSSWNDSEHTKDHKKTFNSWMSKDNKVIVKDNKIGKMINGKFTTENDIDKLLNESKKDFASMTALGGIILNATNLGKEDKGIKSKAINNSFNEKQTRAQIMDVIKKGNIKSLMFDPILDGAPFVEEVLEMPELKNITYKSLGLTPPKNDDDGMINETLTRGDATKIATALTESPIGPELLGDYFTKIVAQNNKEASQEVAEEEVESSINNMSAAEIINNFRNKNK